VKAEMDERKKRNSRRRATLTLTLRNIKEWLIDWFGRRQVIIDCGIHIYTWLDIAVSMDTRILTKYGENLDSDSGLIHEKQTLRFPKPEPPVLHLEHF
jgi:hypothetical protein